ncbi:disease resistance protein TAO1 isoform X1 [Arachis duranensis]|uniref:Disease resistance protein TAO1 isoform X1 n=1 Tax=Arachis duranensis TaxID=130453 RepID=A0A9C6TB95_ARADU|nr:disease resistance protein TAO1 isoform X1 [Arachis duranensis]
MPSQNQEYDAYIISGLEFLHPFISDLYDALESVGLHVLADRTELKTNTLLLSGAIERCRVSIIVFTIECAESTLYLQELVKIMECHRRIDQKVVPVFYCLDPSQVCNLSGYFGEILSRTLQGISREENRMLSYETALRQAASILPRFIPDIWNDRKVMSHIVGHVTTLIDSTKLFIEHPVGVESRVQDLIQLVINNQKADGVLIIAIWGMAGIGKTTIAKALYNQISHNFEVRTFVPDIQDSVADYTRRRLHFILRDPDETQAHNFDSTRKLWWEGLRCIKVLLILDNVRSDLELGFLAVTREIFGPGSIIIITTRTKHDRLHEIGVNHIYRVKEMDYNECVELFSWSAFNKATPERSFSSLINYAIEYSDGLPLALVAVGSAVSEKSIEEWENVLDSFKRFPFQDVWQVLKENIDSVGSEEKKIFLELAYLSHLFIGVDRNDICQILQGAGHHDASRAIKGIEEHSLVWFDKDKLCMNRLLQDIGREMYMKESSIEPQDENRLARGENLSISLLKAIGESKTSIIILSPNYAFSRWCLQELEDIMICCRNKTQKVLPVFYHIDPSEVRNQTGKFGQAFDNLMKRYPDKIKGKEQSWRKALREVGCIAGFVIRKSRNESEDIKNIVEHITHMLDMKELFVANHPVGVESRVEEVIELLKDQQQENPLLLGIWGMGGSGKTTISKAIYNKLFREFEGRCFLLNIREVWDQDNGILYLQQQLLSSIFKTTKIKVENIESGKSILEKRLGQKKILLVLDDVDKLEQLNSLAASRKWFCPGSIIIITTRDEHLLRCLRIDKLYSMKELNDKESIELFSWHAFKEPYPKEEFDSLANEVISYCERLPLALEVIGSHLFNREVYEWRSVLNKLKTIPNNDVQKKLKISFDGLSDDRDREIFLDVAFFFIGMDKNDVIDILNGCGHSAEIGMNVLMERCLITVDTKGKLGMHGLLRDMGREIIRESLPMKPEERSRLWNPDEVLNVLSKDMGTKGIEGLALNLPKSLNPTQLKTEAFKEMKRLRLLQFANVQLVGDFKYLSTDLRWLCWHECPPEYTTANFYQGNLVAIDFKYSKLDLVWKKGQMMKNLKILNLSHSQHLTQTPDFSNMPNLEKLILKYCLKLTSVSHTIEHLKQVLLINLKGCSGLRVLPRSIYKLKSLKTLILSGCSSIDKLEEDIEQMESLTTLMADKTAITQVPHALLRLKSIVYISLCDFEGLSRNVFPSIIWSWTCPTNNFSRQVQTLLDLSNLVSLIVPNRNSQGLSSIIRELPQVQNVRMECGSQLQITGDVASDTCNVTNCDEMIVSSCASSLGCCSEGDVTESENSLNSILIQMGMNCSVTKVLRENILQKFNARVPGECLLPGNNNPDWLTFSGKGSFVNFDVPHVNGCKLKTMMLCVSYSSSPSIKASEGHIIKNLFIINLTKTTHYLYDGDTLASLREEEWHKVISNLEAGDKVQIVVVARLGIIVKKIVVYLIYGEPIDIVCGDDMVADGNVTVHGGDEKKNLKSLGKRKLQRV